MIILAIVGGPLGDLGSQLVSSAREFIFPPSQDITLDFNDVLSCSQGKLVDIRKMFDDPNIPLTNGADMLTICDTESLQTTRPGLIDALRMRFPGCLVWRGKDSGGLIMVRKGEAVCALSGGKGFVCDGAMGRHSSGTNATGDSVDPVRPCPDSTLRRFGFQS